MAPQPGALYLDPILPLAVRRAPAVVPVCDAGAVVMMVIIQEGSCRRSGTVHTGPVLVWAPPARFLQLAVRSGWALLAGVQLVEDLALFCHGDPGACRFLDELTAPGAVPLEEDALDRAFAALERLETELVDRPPAYRGRARGIFAEIVLDLYRASLRSDPVPEGAGYRLARVIRHMESHYAEELTLPQLADILGCSPAYLSRLFRAQVGQPPFEYLNRLRIRHACTLLRRTQQTVTAIAVDVGYNNLSFFNRYFRKVMNCSPREYRRRIQE